MQPNMRDQIMNDEEVRKSYKALEKKIEEVHKELRKQLGEFPTTTQVLNSISVLFNDTRREFVKFQQAQDNAFFRLQKVAEDKLHEPL